MGPGLPRRAAGGWPLRLVLGEGIARPEPLRAVRRARPGSLEEPRRAEGDRGRVRLMLEAGACGSSSLLALRAERAYEGRAVAREE